MPGVLTYRNTAGSSTAVDTSDSALGPRSPNGEPSAVISSPVADTSGLALGNNMVMVAIVDTQVLATPPMQSAITGPSPQIVAAAYSSTPNSSDIVFGIPIEDNGTVKVIRRVIILATVAATFYILHFIGNLMRGAYNSPSSQDSSTLWTATSSLLIELSIPACGYYGALHSNRQLTCCFCSCNLFVTVVSIMSFIRFNIHIGDLDGQCEKERNASQRRNCEVWSSDGAEKYLMIASMILVICLGCLAFWFGNSLYQRLAHEFNSGPPTLPVVGEVISLSSLSPVPGMNTVPLAAGSTLPAAIAASTAGNDSNLVQDEESLESNPQLATQEQL